MSGFFARRAQRYRRLALRETDCRRAATLYQLADEAERGVLCMSREQLRLQVSPVAVRQEPAAILAWRSNWRT